MTAQAFFLLFAAVLANQAGVPFPVVPSLVAAGALSAHAGTGMVPSILVTVVATLVADAIWYGLGRWWGRDALRTVGSCDDRQSTSTRPRAASAIISLFFCSAADSFPN
jgi:membrane protein DedA with SNARE-associated domain